MQSVQRLASSFFILNQKLIFLEIYLKTDLHTISCAPRTHSSEISTAKRSLNGTEWWHSNHFSRRHAADERTAGIAGAKMVLIVNIWFRRIGSLNSRVDFAFCIMKWLRRRRLHQSAQCTHKLIISWRPFCLPSASKKCNDENVWQK